MLLGDEGFGIHLADVLGARGADSGPAVLAGELHTADGGVVARGAGGNGGDGSHHNNTLGTGSRGCNYEGGSGGGGGGYYGGRTTCCEDGKGYGGTSYMKNTFVNQSFIIGINDGAGKARLTWYGESL